MKRLRKVYGDKPLTPAMKQWRLKEINRIPDLAMRDETRKAFLRGWAVAMAEGSRRAINAS